MKIYQAVFLNETIGFFVSEIKAINTIINMVKNQFKNEWTEAAIEEWINLFMEDQYDDCNGIWTEEHTVDMDTSLEDEYV
jgi:hypothetical protein